MCAFRDGGGGPEVLMVQRSPSAPFMAGAWVFPGGAVDPLDSSPAAAAVVTGAPSPEAQPWMAAAVRELVEEVQVWITDPPVVLSDPEPFVKDEAVYVAAAAAGRNFDLGRLAYFANWITPSMVPVRFDTRFFAVAVTPDVAPYPDPSELAAARWVAPAAALQRAATGRWVVPFPTMKTLERFTGFVSAASLVSTLGELDHVPAVQPRMWIDDEGAVTVVLPGEPGFDDLDDAPPDPEALARAAEAAAADGAHLPEVSGDAG
jgi:8-oxo-dGTP pyrophosphatase MutT (NUDIX family)